MDFSGSCKCFVLEGLATGVVFKGAVSKCLAPRGAVVEGSGDGICEVIIALASFLVYDAKMCKH